MRFLVRPYGADAPLVKSAVNNGARIDGLVVDAHITKLAPNAVWEARDAMRYDAEFLIDPVTHKICKPFFRAKKRSFQRLSYYFANDLCDRPPLLDDLNDRAEDGAEKVLALQRELDVTAYISPYLYVQPDDFSGSDLSAFTVGRKWVAEFMRRATDKPTYLSICIDAGCLTDPDSLIGLYAFLAEHKPAGIYLLLFDWELGASTALTHGVLDFLHRLRDRGISRVIYSHAPPWIYFLDPHGVTDFVSGINYQNTLRREYLDREEDIGGIQHNYYIPKRFCRMTPAEAKAASTAGFSNLVTAPHANARCLKS